MRMIWQAIRAVAVEALGVGAVLFMLFGAAGWTVESAGVRPQQEVDRAWKWVQAKTGQVAASVQPKLTAEQRQKFAAERLEHYGHMYGEAASSYANRAARRLDVQIVPADQRPTLSPNQLLGTL